MSRNVLVTGGAGYIGSHTCKALHRAGYQPIVLDNFVRGQRHNVRWGPHIEHDLTSTKSLAPTLREFEIGSVIHFAAYAYVAESMRRPDLYLRDNVLGTVNLLEAMKEAGIRHIVGSSSCATYGNPTRLPIAEDHPQIPVNPYGESKLIAEKTLRWYEHAHEIRFTALRYFNAAGADMDGEIGEEHDPEPHLIPTVIAAAHADRTGVDVYGTDYPTNDGTAIRDFVHVADLANAHVLALRHLLEESRSEILNLGTGEGTSVNQIIDEVERITDTHIPRACKARRAGDPPILVADGRRAEAMLGWKPELSNINTILTSALRWHSRRAAKSAA